MKTARLSTIVMIAAIIFTFSQSTFAQYSDSAGIRFNNPLSATVSTMIWNKINQAAMAGAMRNSRSSGKTARGNTTVPKTEPYDYGPVVPDTRSAASRASEFRSTGTRIMLDPMVDSLGGSPEIKTQNRRLLSGILDHYDSEAGAQGYRNDLALAIVSYIVLNGSIYYDKQVLPTERFLEMRHELAEGMGADASIARMTDRDKQSAYELLVMTSGLTYYLYDRAREQNNSELIKMGRLAAADNLKKLGIKP